MNKSELVSTVHEILSTRTSKKHIQEVVEVTLESIVACLANQEDVRIAGFGNFVLSEQAAREGRNPMTGEPLTIPGRSVVRFRPAKYIKERINQH